MAVMRIARSEKIYYGWFIVAVALLVQFAAPGIQGFSLGVFMKPMAHDLGWSRGAISGVQSVGTVIGGILGLFIGGTLDRRGARALMLIGAVITGLGFIALSAMNQIWQFYLIRGLLIATGTTFAGIMVSNTAVSNWFVRKRGRAISIAGMGVPLAGIVMLPFTQFLVDKFTWRTTWILLGFMVWAIAIVPTALFIRRRPEDLGLVPDGRVPTERDDARLSASQKAALQADVVWTRSEAIRTPTLWMIIVGCSLGSMTLPMTMMHLMPFVSDLGFTPEVAATAASVHSMLSLASKIPWGYAIERFHPRHVAVMTYSMAAAGLTMLLFVRSLEGIVIALAVLGIGVGGVMPVTEVIWASYFGRISLGKIRSLGMPFSIVSSAGGPLMGGLVYDWTKSYAWAFVFLICTLALGATILSLLRPARHPRLAKAAGTAAV